VPIERGRLSGRLVSKTPSCPPATPVSHCESASSPFPAASSTARKPPHAKAPPQTPVSTPYVDSDSTGSRPFSTAQPYRTGSHPAPDLVVAANPAPVRSQTLCSPPCSPSTADNRSPDCEPSPAARCSAILASRRKRRRAATPSKTLPAPDPRPPLRSEPLHGRGCGPPRRKRRKGPPSRSDRAL